MSQEEPQSAEDLERDLLENDTWVVLAEPQMRPIAEAAGIGASFLRIPVKDSAQAFVGHR